jgi:hypothetical protein
MMTAVRGGGGGARRRRRWRCAAAAAAAVRRLFINAVVSIIPFLCVVVVRFCCQWVCG